MESDNADNNKESDYELALRLAGLSPKKPEPIALDHATNGEEFSAFETARLEGEEFETPIVPVKVTDVRVNVLNRPKSILKKWGKAESSLTPLDEVAKKEPPRPLEIDKPKNDHSELDHFFDKPKTKSFEKVFTELDQEPLFDSEERVNLDSLDNELEDVEFKPKGRLY